MFSTIQEGVEVYKNTLRSYQNYMDRLRADGYTTMENLGASKQYTVEILNEKLNGMAEVLGLSDEEQKCIETECGIEQFDC